MLLHKFLLLHARLERHIVFSEMSLLFVWTTSSVPWWGNVDVCSGMLSKGWEEPQETEV